MKRENEIRLPKPYQQYPRNRDILRESTYIALFGSSYDRPKTLVCCCFYGMRGAVAAQAFFGPSCRKGVVQRAFGDCRKTDFLFRIARNSRERGSDVCRSVGKTTKRHPNGNPKNPKRVFHGYPLTLGKTKTPEKKLFELKSTWLASFVEKYRSAKILLLCHDKEMVVDLEKVLKETTTAKIAFFHSGMNLMNRDRQAAYFADPEGAYFIHFSYSQPRHSQKSFTDKR